MLHDEVETSEGSYERTGDGEHDDHREYQHHSRIMFSEPEEEQFTFFLQFATLRMTHFRYQSLYLVQPIEQPYTDKMVFIYNLHNFFLASYLDISHHP